MGPLSKFYAESTPPIKYRVNNYLKWLLWFFISCKISLTKIVNLRCKSLLSYYNFNLSVIQSASHYNIQSASHINRHPVSLIVSYSASQSTSQPGNIIFNISASSKLVLQSAIHYSLHPVSHCNRKQVYLTVIYSVSQSTSLHYNIQPVSHCEKHQVSLTVSYSAIQSTSQSVI